MRALPVGADLLVFLGEDAVAGDTQPDEVVKTVGHMVRAYTRGRGFPLEGMVEDDIAAVIVTAAARLFHNPDMATREEAGAMTSVPGLFSGWTLPELAVLHRYRRRTA